MKGSSSLLFTFAILYAFVLCVAFGFLVVPAVQGSSESQYPAPSGASSYTYNLTILGITYQIDITTNASVSNFGWVSNGIGVQFEATTPSGSSVFCDFAVPENLLGSDISVLVDGSPLVKDVDYTQSREGTNSVFHFTFTGGTHVVEARTSTVTSSPTPTATPASSVTLDAWSPTLEDAAFAAAVAVGSTAVAAAIMSAAHPAEDSIWRYFEKTKETLPDDGRKWASDFVGSKRQLKVNEKRGSRFLPTKQEAAAYAVGIAVLAFCYAYVKVAFDLTGFLEVLPTILLTFIIVEFIKIFVVTVFVRAKGVWAEHKIWPLGLLLLAITTFAFRMPLSSPTRIARHGPKSSRHLEVIVASVESLVNIVFVGVFYVILVSGFTLLGSTGLAFCVMMAFFESLPIPPMASREIWHYNKGLWAALFAATTTLFFTWLLLL